MNITPKKLYPLPPAIEILKLAIVIMHLSKHRLKMQSYTNIYKLLAGDDRRQ